MKGLRVLGPSFILIDKECRLEVANAFQTLRLDPVLQLSIGHWVILLHTLLHFGLHPQDHPILKLVELFLACLYLGVEDAILV